MLLAMLHLNSRLSPSGATDKNVISGHTRCLDTLADLLLVVIDGCGIDMTIPGFQSDLDSILDLIWLGLLVTLSALSISPPAQYY